MIRRKSEPKTISEVLTNHSKKMGLASRMRIYKLLKLWPEITGAKVSQHSQPVRLRGRTLIIQVNHPAWMQEMSLLKPQILDQIEKKIDAFYVDDIRFELGEIDENPFGEPQSAAAVIRALSDDEKDFINIVTGEIKDPELQDVAKRAMEKGFGRKKN